MSKTYTKGDLTRDLAGAAGVHRRDAEAVLEKLGGVIRKAVANGLTVPIPELGRFREKVRAARTARNPATGLPVDVPERAVLSFTPSKANA